MTVIPAIDLIGGSCVRLTQGDYNQVTAYDADPVSVAARYAAAGINRLHIVDLDGAKQKQPVHIPLLQRITRTVPELVIDYGGGINTRASAEAVFAAGAAMLTVGSIAVKHRSELELRLKEWQASRILVGIDVLNGTVRVSGWQEDAGLSVYTLMDELCALGVFRFFCTDISKDGLLNGPSVDLYRTLRKRYPHIELIASGGVAELNDLWALHEAGCDGAIVGKAIYEGRITLDDITRFHTQTHIR